jgi:hypothetical protein
MTYWPISSPSVFAATKQSTTQQGTTRVSHDGTAPAAAAAPAAPDEDDSDGHSLAHHGQEDDMAGEVLAMEVTRSGHMFATITRSTLTIWQTKAGRRCPGHRPVSMDGMR